MRCGAPEHSSVHSTRSATLCDCANHSVVAAWFFTYPINIRGCRMLRRVRGCQMQCGHSGAAQHSTTNKMIKIIGSDSRAVMTTTIRQLCARRERKARCTLTARVSRIIPPRHVQGFVVWLLQCLLALHPPKHKNSACKYVCQDRCETTTIYSSRCSRLMPWHGMSTIFIITCSGGMHMAWPAK